MITIERFLELKKKHGLHDKAQIQDLPAKVLAEELTIMELVGLIAQTYWGNHFDALRIKDKEAFLKYDHHQWDLTLSAIGGTRLCGLPNKKGECPYPFEEEFEFWVNARGYKIRGRVK